MGPDDVQAATEPIAGGPVPLRDFLALPDGSPPSPSPSDVGDVGLLDNKYIRALWIFTGAALITGAAVGGLRTLHHEQRDRQES